MIYVYDRGHHTTVIEGAEDIVKLFKKAKIGISPGVISGTGGTKKNSVKLNKLNDETFRMIVVVKGFKQSFTVYGQNQQHVFSTLIELRKNGWRVSEETDVSVAI